MRPGGQWLRNVLRKAVRMAYFPLMRSTSGCRVEPAGATNQLNQKNMKQINWRHGVLLMLMAVGLCLVGGDVETETAFWINKLLGLAALTLMYLLHERWWRTGKIAKYRIR